MTKSKNTAVYNTQQINNSQGVRGLFYERVYNDIFSSLKTKVGLTKQSKKKKSVWNEAKEKHIICSWNLKFF